MRAHIIITSLTLCESALTALQHQRDTDAKDALNALCIVNEGWPFALPNAEKAFLALDLLESGAASIPESWGTPSYMVADTITTLRAML